ncbi:protein translocase subunit SecF [Clostridium pasteurianum DSM 525 = ATCC 6013]|uniref:Protein-export membrane protein SecF n=1 Tax=Clostridium pasteurianum DSM 525 = ATCC 6013 TaxID=1262449 RepID=A0A0H3J8L8_CLOPA|nr:protein translocase subunit SecF [Clostridium pasteurianum]AJA48293.1 protein translocase subunit SecF [Clostridium pasteurianum DSM 525 = ATCC 6013]AJA52281.1 protein translocase subunit SecF [Clostridium pasteurianum DSM 525 = ATCC 6013]AOZ75545.1 preprotein translocase subunit SecF [Clostridium pasteurianum DSM 525 = ATCC 6013]AOZ79340.1 preprotein translocase subunit SecF [Clostridium pasteurianum]ELP60557.1 preprotein translocase subunit SecF [Clostridium pasteurianum DSM 525 = ATCC 60
MIKVVENRKIWFTISAILIIISIGFTAYRGLNFGIDFRGGTIIQININKDFNKEDADKIIQKYVKANEFETTKANNKELDIRINSEAISDENSTKLFNDIKEKYKLKDSNLINRERIGATVGNELIKKAVISLAVSMVLMLAFIAYRFEFKFGLAAVIALIHDILITLGVYAIGNLPINTPFIAAILTIIGYSIADTIVIFDRIRENQRKLRGKDLIEMADISIYQTVGRSICTVTTTIVTITCVHIFVPSVREFTLPILVGIASGCYSSIFIASPVWFLLKKRANKRKIESKKS